MFKSARALAFSVLVSQLVIFISISASAFERGQQFPRSPDPQMTPGKLCANGSTRRYPEGIAYCNRNVDSSLKKEIFAAYDNELGYSTRSMSRAEFKIDHYIPLCAGGSNSVENLWPQHRSIYNITDPMEQPLCERMAEGKLKQAEAIELIKRGKNNLEDVPEIVDYLENL